MNMENEILDPRSDKAEQAASGPTDTTDASKALPEDVLILVPMRNTVLFPGVVMPITVGREKSIAAVQEAVRSERPVGVLLQRDASVDAPGSDDLHRTGTVASVLRYVAAAEGVHHLICKGERRFRVLDFLPGFPFLVARIDYFDEPTTDTKEVEARALLLRKKALEAIELLPQAPAELSGALQQTADPAALANMVASFMDIDLDEKQALLETRDLHERLDKVIGLLSDRLDVLRLTRELDEQTQEKMSARQREYMLREQLKTIRRELGEDEGGGAEVEEIEAAIESAAMPEEAEKEARRELKRLERMSDASAEYSMVRNYLDWLTALPWSRLDDEVIDIAAAERILDEDHHGLEKVKKRILEFLAVRKLNPEGRSPILCLVGPPGVGKTSLGKSIARAMGLEFVRASLGGVHDEAEMRGHRRTYIGALPGNIIQAIRKAGTRNPVFMLDEMDKLGVGFHGDPASALLEVLDPEQNATFRDNYLGVPFDLSRVLFIGTANVLDNIPGPLRDRMEVIEIASYTDEEKLEIAREYLLPRQREQNGIDASQVAVDDSALARIISDYTREAGVRNLERQIGALLRHAAVRIAADETLQLSLSADDVPAILGPAPFERETAARTGLPGVATGLAWTPVGGDILFIEAMRSPGKGKLILTGQLGDVMRESAQAALSLLKSRAAALGVDPGELESSDIHIHVPAGAIPKDGPSAGVAMYVALVSLATGRPVKSGLAMTGEVSLRGLVLPVGGIKEKCLAAVRAGIGTVLLPARNRKDLEDIPQSARSKLDFVWLEHLDEAVQAALEEAPQTAPADAA
ncbi:MAG: endopeptidase La [Gammaproteobacteria bacterium]|nr:endopeptidase La [Gammaproteobacteria bacterium]NIM72689.1 endopeptidase La [Gammaproteobacteria bacterium]NIO65053.1 endopeptidase La [Gammaproteobacteria bacterium]NIP63866.1 endopeptidase La [Gammaproteobacteria bacterium]NIT91555.1 endopeptidase La [Gammaproteobacteria bacterium]